jgi:hypothetical protein
MFHFREACQSQPQIILAIAHKFSAVCGKGVHNKKSESMSKPMIAAKMPRTIWAGEIIMIGSVVTEDSTQLI